MNNKVKIFAVILIFILGAGICLYPTVASYLNKKNETHAVDTMNEAIEKTDKKTIDTEKEKVRKYNISLANNRIVLTDPFDPDAFPITDGEYSELLSLTDTMASIVIPKIGVSLPIYHGTDEKTLETGVGHLENTSLPMGGESTHCVLSAHTGLPSAKLFTDIDKLVIGDVFYINVLGEKLSYEVDSIKVVEPDDASSLMIVNGKDYVTLFTCTPYGRNTHRLLVRGTRIENEISEKKEADQLSSQSFSEKLLSKYGLTVRDLIVFIAIAVFAFIFVIILIIIIGLKRVDKKREEKNKKNT